jgi:hypothetical protein
MTQWERLDAKKFGGHDQARVQNADKRLVVMPPRLAESLAEN